MVSSTFQKTLSGTDSNSLKTDELVNFSRWHWFLSSPNSKVEPKTISMCPKILSLRKKLEHKSTEVLQAELEKIDREKLESMNQSDISQ